MAAAMELLAEVGPYGLTLAMAAERAGVSRALPTYQFRTRNELLAAAAAELLGDQGAGEEFGLEPLMAWIGEQLKVSDLDAIRMRARLAFIVGPPEPAASAAVAAYWSTRVEIVRRHLEQAKMLRRIPDDLDPPGVASVIVGLLHGEIARVSWGHGEANVELFLTMMRNSLAGPPMTVRPRPKKSKAPHKDQRALWPSPGGAIDELPPVPTDE
jgi:AcrR family transcriptional regulator